MECTSVSGYSSQIVTSPTDMMKGHENLRETFSWKDFCTRARTQQSYSDNHFPCFANRVRASARQPKLKSHRSVELFKFHFPSSTVPKSLCSFVVPETNKDRYLIDNDKLTDRYCDDEDGESCEVDYSDEEVDGKTGIDRETLLKLLKPVSWLDTKRFSQLAFLCNMALMIPEIKLRRLW